MSEGLAKDNKAEVESKVRAVLRSEPRLGTTFHLKALMIEPDGSVILEGDVPSMAAKKLALEKVASIPGITGIVDRLHVEPATTQLMRGAPQEATSTSKCVTGSLL